MGNKVAVIEFYRYVFMLVLLSWHGGYCFFRHGYLVVEFFFILSGYFLMNSFLKSHKTPIQYTINRLKKTYFEYFIALCITFLYFGIIKGIIQGTLSIEIFLKFIPEALLIQNIGIFDGGFNTPMWYFSVLIVGGGLLYCLIYIHKNLSLYFIIPILIIIFFTFLFDKQASLENFKRYGFIYAPFIRGVAEMGLGVILCAFTKSKYNKVKNSIFLDCITVLALSLIFYILYSERTYDKYVLILFPYIIYSAISNKNFISYIVNHRLWVKLGGCTFEMFLLHIVIGNIFNNVVSFVGIKLSIITFIINVFLVTLLSLLFKSFTDKLGGFLVRICNFCR